MAKDDKEYCLEVMLRSGKHCRYARKNYHTAVADAGRLAKAMRAKKQMVFELYEGEFFRLSEIACVGTSSGLWSGWH